MSLGQIQKFRQMRAHAPWPIEIESLKRKTPDHNDRDQKPQIGTERRDPFRSWKHLGKSKVICSQPAGADQHQVEAKQKTLQEFRMALQHVQLPKNQACCSLISFCMRSLNRARSKGAT